MTSKIFIVKAFAKEDLDLEDLNSIPSGLPYISFQKAFEEGYRRLRKWFQRKGKEPPSSSEFKKGTRDEYGFIHDHIRSDGLIIDFSKHYDGTEPKDLECVVFDKKDDLESGSIPKEVFHFTIIATPLSG